MKLLGSKAIDSFLNDLTPDRIHDFQNVMLGALKQYKEDPSIIPPRTVSSKGNTTHLFMPSLGSDVGMKLITGSPSGFKGATLIIDPIDGAPIGLIDGAIVTAFRTALCSTIPLVKVLPLDSKDEHSIPKKIFVNGVGAQAYWHIKLTLILYSNSINEVFICNRTLSKTEALCSSLSQQYGQVKFTPVPADDSESIKNAYKEVSIVYGCVPTTSPGILKEYIDQSNKKIYISVIGSYKPHMTEVDRKIVGNILESNRKIIVDSKEHAGHEAGELIQNNVKEENLVEVYDFYQGKDEKESNITLCKLVGLSIMDITIGAELLRLCPGLEVDF